MKYGELNLLYDILNEWKSLPEILALNEDDLSAVFSNAFEYIIDKDIFEFIHEKIGYKLKEGVIDNLYIDYLGDLNFGTPNPTVISLDILDYMLSTGVNNAEKIMLASVGNTFWSLKPFVEKYNVPLLPKNLSDIFAFEIPDFRWDLLNYFLENYKSKELIDLLSVEILDLIKGHKLNTTEALEMLKLLSKDW